MKVSDKPTHIYQLIAYGTHVPRYVGKTVDSLEWRTYRHVKKALKGNKGHRDSWIRETLHQKGEIKAELLETVPPGSDWEEAEMRWIRELRLMGCPLTNATDGGEGSTGWQPSVETKARRKATILQRHGGYKGRIKGSRWGPRTEQECLNISKNHAHHWLGTHQSPELIKKRGAAITESNNKRRFGLLKSLPGFSSMDVFNDR